MTTDPTPEELAELTGIAIDDVDVFHEEAEVRLAQAQACAISLAGADTLATVKRWLHEEAGENANLYNIITAGVCLGAEIIVGSTVSADRSCLEEGAVLVVRLLRWMALHTDFDMEAAYIEACDAGYGGDPNEGDDDVQEV